ncbi:MAG: hypothetical protein MZU91_01900 [Desulfosudis oleivorans]|nr:hypothetical protein [Desulfosudis oleivorans]
MNQQAKATTTRKTFSRETSVSASIEADPAIVWALLTHAADYPRWNSTVISIKDEIREERPSNSSPLSMQKESSN